MGQTMRKSLTHWAHSTAAQIFAFGVWRPASHIWVGLSISCSGQRAPGAGAGLALHLSELVAGLWCQCQRELSRLPALGHWGCVPHPRQLCQAPGAAHPIPCSTGTEAQPLAGCWPWSWLAGQGAAGHARLKTERSPAFHGCQFGRKALIPGQFSSPFGFSVA